MPIMLDTLTFKGFYLKEVVKAVLIFHEVADKLRDVAETLDLEVVLAE